MNNLSRDELLKRWICFSTFGMSEFESIDNAELKYIWN